MNDAKVGCLIVLFVCPVPFAIGLLIGWWLL